MTIRQILTEPDPQLRIKSKPVQKVDAEIKKLMKDMLDTMYAAPGIGLAAVQIGVHKRVIVIDIAKEPELNNPKYFVNPEIVWTSQTKCTFEEGCLSLPKQFAEIERPEKDLNGDVINVPITDQTTTYIPPDSPNADLMKLVCKK